MNDASQPPPSRTAAAAAAGGFVGALVGVVAAGALMGNGDSNTQSSVTPAEDRPAMVAVNED